jgi:transposase
MSGGDIRLMLGGRTVKQVLELNGAGASIRRIARTLGISRNTVRRYLRASAIPQAAARPPRVSKLAPYTEHVLARVGAGIENCQVLLRELRERGYTGGYTILKELVHPLRPRPPLQGTMRFETAPGEQAQVDFGSCPYQGVDGRMHRVWAFTMVLSWSRMLYVEFVRLADTATFVRCHLHAFEYFGGVPQRCLYDRTKLVVLGRGTDGTPLWNERFLDFALRIGMDIQLCRGYRPQTKGRVESGIKYVKGNFWPGIQFIDDEDLNRQGRTWYETVANVRVHGTTHERPIDRWPAERAALHALPTPDRLEVFFWDERRVARDGYVRWEGTSYGLPWPWRPGQAVQVQARQGLVELWVGRDRRAVYPRGQRPGQHQTHPRQWAGLAPREGRPRPDPQGVQRMDLEIEQRPLAAYAALVGG